MARSIKVILLYSLFISRMVLLSNNNRFVWHIVCYIFGQFKKNIMILEIFCGVLFFLTTNGKYLLVDIKEKEYAMANNQSIDIEPRSLAAKSTYSSIFRLKQRI